MAKKKKSSASTSDLRGVADASAAADWLEDRGLEDIECIVPDMSGVARGKMMPVSKFIDAPTMSIPGSIFTQTITGDYPDDDDAFQIDAADSDIKLVPDYSTLAVVPWASDPTGQIIHDAYHQDGRPVEIAPRQLLRRIIGLYEHKGWKPVVAPELEFYLVERNQDPDYPLKPPVGRSGRPESGRQSYSIAAVNEFDDLFDDIYDFSEAQGLEIDTLIHEEGVAQMEINLRHGDPLALADQVFLFKRTIREAAVRHDMYATFMAKPIADEPGSAMHIHQSVVDLETGENIFSNADGGPTREFFHFIGGQQKFLPNVMCMLAPYVNSYRRLMRKSAAPVNVHWGYDNRTVGLRIPNSGPGARRVENRVPSSDANPYLALAASLACGYIGMVNGLNPGDPVEGSAYDLDFGLPRGLLEAVALFEESEELVEIFGNSFSSTYRAIKQAEFETFMRVISPWEREYLLLNV
ncbi:glutamine synthetase family protein [Pinisolibacter aquiterrae]|uniref:glutamine synthetase family protein n=1 Tax=Pinisolibacter aquiterrae TaxID=2815579 RepID=UPI001C3DBC75|nr:glutamine synthetase family protein [Pinisolibacter aquiterrae]MBV5263474.1 glutamine synthetase [Pinisolibacter aquiterrae]MCC8237449.1 glutamine synthetase family protein [Pinisolibacter aquiterrae]